MRFVSCVVHSACALTVLWLLRSLKLPPLAAVLGAALFATHPVHIENIVYTVGRADSLSSLLSLMAILLYLKQALRGTNGVLSYAALIVLTAASGLCKEPGFTVLFFLACAELVLRCRIKHIFLLFLAFVAVGGARVWYVGGTEAGFGYIDTPIRYMDERLTRTLSYLCQHAYYAKLLVLPWHQSWDYSFDALPMVRSFLDVRLLAIFAAFLAIAALATHGLRTHKQNPVVILGLGLVVIPFIPASNLFFLVGTTVGERLLYPCTIGWSVLVGAFLAGQQRTGERWLRRSLVILLLGIYVWNSNVRMSHWETPSRLFETDAVHFHRSAKVLHSKASELQARGDLPGALEYYLESLKVFDDQAITDYCIARILINLDRFDEAHLRFNKILNGHGIGLHDGNDFLWMTDLGYLLVRLGSDQQGVHYLKEGLQRMPYNCFAWNALGVGQARQGQLEEAVQSLNDGLQCAPDAVSMWINLALVYAYGNAISQANDALQRATTLNASHPAVRHNTLVLMGRGDLQPHWDLYIPKPGRR